MEIFFEIHFELLPRCFLRFLSRCYPDVFRDFFGVAIEMFFGMLLASLHTMIIASRFFSRCCRDAFGLFTYYDHCFAILFEMLSRSFRDFFRHAAKKLSESLSAWFVHYFEILLRFYHIVWKSSSK